MLEIVVCLSQERKRSLFSISPNSKLSVRSLSLVEGGVFAVFLPDLRSLQDFSVNYEPRELRRSDDYISG